MDDRTPSAAPSTRRNGLGENEVEHAAICLDPDLVAREVTAFLSEDRATGAAD